MVSKQTSGHPIQLSTVAGSNSATRQIVLVKLGHDVEVEAILVNDLNIFNYNMNLPASWNKFKTNWCDQISDHDTVNAQVLIGSDTAILHPKDATDEHGQVIETDSARLKISVLTGKLLAHGNST